MPFEGKVDRHTTSVVVTSSLFTRRSVLYIRLLFPARRGVLPGGHRVTAEMDYGREE